MSGQEQMSEPKLFFNWTTLRNVWHIYKMCPRSVGVSNVPDTSTTTLWRGIRASKMP